MTDPFDFLNIYIPLSGVPRKWGWKVRWWLGLQFILLASKAMGVMFSWEFSARKEDL